MENTVKPAKKYNFSTLEVAIMLKMSQNTVIAWARRNHIPKFNRTYMFSTFAIERLKKSRKTI